MSIFDRSPGGSEKQPRSVVVLAALGLVTVAVIAVGAMAWSVVVAGKSTEALVSIASIAIGALATLAGVAKTTPTNSETREPPTDPGQG